MDAPLRREHIARKMCEKLKKRLIKIVCLVPAPSREEPPDREWTNQESWLLTPDSLETFLRWESESRVTIQDSRVRSQLKSPSENLENFEHFLLIYLVNEALKCWKWSSYSKRYLNMVKVVNKVKDELEKLPHFTVSYGIKIGSDRESWLELESSNLGQGRESESEYWNKVTRPFPNDKIQHDRNNFTGKITTYN